MQVEDHGRIKLRYLAQDHKRWTARTGLPFKHPPASMFPIKTTSAMRMFIRAEQQGRGEAFAEAVFRAYWERNEDISDPLVLGAVTESVEGLSADELIAYAESEDGKHALAEATDAAMERGVFGAPQFLVGEELFWGKDRLDFVEDMLVMGEIREKGLSVQSKL